MAKLYRKKDKNGKPYGPWLYDFRWESHRHHGSTGERTKAKAEAVYEQIRLEIKTGVRRSEITMNEACVRMYNEVYRFHAAPKTALANLERLANHFGKNTFLHKITTGDMARLIAERLSSTANATINRFDIAPMRHLMNRARKVWNKRTSEIDWKELKRPEPPERVRELSPEKEAELVAAMPADLKPLVMMATLTGLRQDNILKLKWSQMDETAMVIRVPVKSQKGARKVLEIPLTPSVLKVLQIVNGQDDEFVFTFVAQKTWRQPNTGFIFKKGKRYPIGKTGLYKQWRRVFDSIGLDDWTWHDLRHTFGTRILRQSNLRVTQELMGHSDPKTTAKYAHAMHQDRRAAMERAASASRLCPDTKETRKRKRK